MAFKERLKEARLKKGYTQEKLAGMAGVAKSTFTGYEKGNREPNISTISRILRTLDIDANFLWQDEIPLPFALSYEEKEELVKRYRALDSHGKEMVDFILSREYERSLDIKKEQQRKSTEAAFLPDYLIPNAAHRRTDIPIPWN